MNVLKRLKRVLNRMMSQRTINAYLQYMDVDLQSILEPTFSLRVHNPVEGKKYVTVGSDCIIGGTFIFETKEGHISIGKRSQISGGARLISRTGIEIGDDVTIAGGCLLYDHDSHSIYWEERKNDVLQEIADYRDSGDPLKNKDWSVVSTQKIVIEDKAWLGYGVTVLKGVTIGEGAVIGAQSVVTHDIPPFSVAAGNPARVIKTIERRPAMKSQA